MPEATRGSDFAGMPRALLIRRTLRLERLGVAWLAVEAGVAVASGLAARSISLTAFGIESLIELGSAGVLIGRLGVELRHGPSGAASAERAASRIGGALLFALSAYVAAAAGWALWTRQGQSFSWPGLLVGSAAMPIMWLISRRKLRLAEALHSPALRADAVESMACGWLSLAVVVGLLAQCALGAWWIDAVTSLAILGLLINEGREAWQGGEHG